jgi:XRE family transcriptional regulator, regulator of sulfur utilization
MAVAISARAVKKVRAMLGARLRALRQRGGFTQQELGRRAKLSGKFIGEVERGEKSITLDSLHRLSRALRTTLAEMVSMDASRNGSSRHAARRQPARR